MLPPFRQVQIVQRLRQDGFVEIAELSRSLGVDRSTVRRDLSDLEARGLVLRTRGGALPGATSGQSGPLYTVTRAERTAQKEAIGRAAAELVGDSETVILDAGSTTFQVAVALRHRRDVSVVTNDLYVAMYLADLPRIQLVITGGVLTQSQYTLVGALAEGALSGLHADHLFLGADAIHHEFGVSNTSLVEVPVKRAMISAAREVVVVADSSKFEHRSLAPICTLDEVDVIITDEDLDADARALYGSTLRCVPIVPGTATAPKKSRTAAGVP